MEKINLAYLTVGAAKSYSFYMIPKELIDNHAFDDIDYGGKLLYALMLNRASLSATNPDFIDDNGNVYIIYTIDQVMEDMHCARQTAVNMLKQLDEKGLIEKRRLGQGKPSIIYIKDFSTADLQKSKKYTSKNSKNILQKVQKIDPNHTDLSNTNLSNTESINQPIPENDTSAPNQVPSSNLTDTIRYDTNDINLTKREVKNKIDLNRLQTNHPDKHNEIQELYDIIVETLTSRKKIMRIAKEDMPADIVKQELSRLTYDHLEYILESLRKTTTSVKSTKSYLQTVLFNASKTINNHYSLSAQNMLSEHFGIDPK